MAGSTAASVNKLWIYLRNNGDGSVSPCFFSSEEKAEHYASFDDERNCDDIMPLNTNNIDERHWAERETEND